MVFLERRLSAAEFPAVSNPFDLRTYGYDLSEARRAASRR